CAWLKCAWHLVGCAVFQSAQDWTGGSFLSATHELGARQGVLAEQFAHQITRQTETAERLKANEAAAQVESQLEYHSIAQVIREARAGSAYQIRQCAWRCA